jgi:DNA repair photolyase
MHADKTLLPALEDLANSHKSEKQLFISLSTKVRLSIKTITRLAEINESLLSKRNGFLKLSVSAATFNQKSVEEFELGAASFEHRIETIQIANEFRIPCSVNIKPILPQVEFGEYESIVQHSRRATNLFLLGGLYVSGNNDFGKRTLSEFSHLISKRQVDWLPGSPEWDYVEDRLKLKKLKALILRERAHSFDSDRDLILHINSQIQKSTSLAFKQAI